MSVNLSSLPKINPGNLSDLAKAVGFIDFRLPHLSLASVRVGLDACHVLEGKDIVPMQVGRTVISTSVSNGSVKLTTVVEDWSGLTDHIPVESQAYIFESLDPYIGFTQAMDGQGLISCRIRIGLSPEYFWNVTTHVSAQTPVIGQRAAALSPAAVEIGGQGFSSFRKTDLGWLSTCEPTFLSLSGHVFTGDTPIGGSSDESLAAPAPMAATEPQSVSTQSTPPWENPSQSERPSPELPYVPKCPICKEPMKIKTAKVAWRNGQQFWGCSGFPSCRGVRQL